MNSSEQVRRKQFINIFQIEMWERFAYYSFTSLFILFAISINFSEKQAYMIFGVFSGLAYGLPIIGGYIADKLLGIKRAMIIGATILVVGYLLLGLSQGYHSIMMSLALIALGNCLFKPAPSSLIGMIYNKNAAETKAAFSMYYMAINIGAFLAGIIAPLVAKYFNFHLAFVIASIGMLYALVCFLIRYKLFNALYNSVGNKPLTLGNVIYSAVILMFLFISTYILLNYNNVAFYVIIGVTIVSLAYLALSSLNYNSKHVRIKLLVGVTIFVQAIFFFIIYAQTFSTLVIFAKNNVNLNIFGFEISPASFTSVSYFWILALSPLLAKAYIGLDKKNIYVTTLDKYATAIFSCSLAFFVLYIACQHADITNKVSSLWLILYYFLASIAELFISAIGLAVAAQYFPKEKIGFCMGAWLLATGCGQTFAGKIAGYIAMPDKGISSGESLSIFSNYFKNFSIVCLIVAIIFTLIAIFIRRVGKKHLIKFA